MNLLQDPRLRKIPWMDLTTLTPFETFIENTLPLPWLAASWWIAAKGWWPIALPFSFIFFLTGLRQAHNGFHYALGTSRKINGLTIFMDSILMLTAMHAVKYNHLRHHKYCLGPDDTEGHCARMSAGQALLYGPVYIFRQHATALQSKNPHTTRPVLLELAAIATLIPLAFLYGPGFLQYHVFAMLTGECLTSFFAVWTVHHDCDEEVFARTLGPAWKNHLTYNMFFHLEHHLFPRVPTIKLPILAKRLRQHIPDLKAKQVF